MQILADLQGLPKARQHKIQGPLGGGSGGHLGGRQFGQGAMPL